MQVGKLDFARDKICKVLVTKDMPDDDSDESCTKWMGKVVPNSQGGDTPDCADRFEETTWMVGGDVEGSSCFGKKEQCDEFCEPIQKCDEQQLPGRGPTLYCCNI